MQGVARIDLQGVGGGVGLVDRGAKSVLSGDMGGQVIFARLITADIPVGCGLAAL